MRELLLFALAALGLVQPIEDVVPFEIAFVGHVVMMREEFARLGPDHFDDFILAPDVELALLAFAIGVERSGESPLLRGHLALEPADRLPRALRKQRRMFAG